MSNYLDFLHRKSQVTGGVGFTPIWMPDYLFDFQTHLVEWSLLTGRAANMSDCGMGKCPMEGVWAQNVVMHTGKPVLVVTTAGVVHQTVREFAEKFDIDAYRSGDGKLRPSPVHPGKPLPCVVVTNYDRLHYFSPGDFGGVVFDESSCIKDFKGERQKEVTAFARTLPYRLMCSATAAPNDWIELGTTSEALGYMGRMDLLSMFFKNDENTTHTRYFETKWRLKPHGERDFWRYVCSWARAVRKPSDIGFADGRFILPELIERETVVEPLLPSWSGKLLDLPASGLDEVRAERKATLRERCEAVAGKVSGTGKAALVWCHYNEEADLLVKLIPGAKQVKGADSEDSKAETMTAFADGDLRVLVTKPKIGAWGLNFQHCDHMTYFPDYSFEQYYQSVRRCWRFGQQNPVTVDVVTTEGGAGVLRALKRKQAQADAMFDALVREMNNAIGLNLAAAATTKSEVILPSWL